jgi:hypothetical protein
VAFPHTAQEQEMVENGQPMDEKETAVWAELQEKMKHMPTLLKQLRQEEVAAKNKT